MTYKELDNPVWNALKEHQSSLCRNIGDFKFYPKDYCVFGAFTETNDPEGIKIYAQETDSFFIVGKRPPIPKEVILETELVCLQMVHPGPIDSDYREKIIPLDESHREDIFKLVQIAFPAYFKKKTADLGQYYGIYKDGQLVSMSGERMQLNNYIEISGVMTHPDFRGQGLATQVIKKTTEEVLNKKKIPFLHTAIDNHNAIKIYESLGYETRRTMSFWKFSYSKSIT